MVAITTLGLFNEWVFISVIVALTIAGLYEFFNLISLKGIPIYSYTGIALGVIIPLSTFFRLELTNNWELILLVVSFLWIFLLQFRRKDNRNAIIGISTTLFGVLYVSWLFSYLIKVRFLLPDYGGIKLLGFILIVTKLGDVGALVIGSRFGKHPLMPKISPNKTIEGSMGSFLFGVFAAIAFRGFLPQELGLEIWQIALMGAFFAGLGQVGDMSESLIKRDCNVKDSGTMLYGLGGCLDTIDSLLFSVPAFYFYMSSLLNTI